MGYWISKLESLPNIFDWYFFLVGDYRNHNLINDVFKDDFLILAERLGGNSAIIAQNNLLERDLQDSLKSIERGQLGAFLKNLEERKPGLLILNKHPRNLCHLDLFRTGIREDSPVIIYISFDALEMAYTSANTLIADIVAFSKNQHDDVIRKTSEFGRINDSIDKAVLKRKEVGIVTLNYREIYQRRSEIIARCINCGRIIYVDEHEEKEKCIYCGYINFVEEAINNSSPNNSYCSKRIRCVCGHTMTIPANHDRTLYCPRCGMQIYVKGMARIDIQGDSHREVLEVGQKMLNQSHTLVKQGGRVEMERILIISALEKELQPILEAIDSPLKPQNMEEIGGRKYFIFEISATLTVICTSFLGMGQINAALAVKDAVNYYGVSKVILTGICGGIDRGMKYGDIIISDQIVDYELAKICSDDVQVRWSVYRSDFELVQSLRMFKSDNWSNYLKRLFPDEKYKKPNVYSGIVLSGNKVIANNEEIIRFKKTWSKALAVEMEASGIAAALYQLKNAPSFVMVKAICDFADSEKNDDWQEYAAYASAIFVLNYIFTESVSMSRNASWKTGSYSTPENQKLFSAIRGTYSLSEMNVLAFNIGIDLEEIGGTGKSEKIVELIKYCQRRNLLNNLIAQINMERDNLLGDYDNEHGF